MRAVIALIDRLSISCAVVASVLLASAVVIVCYMVVIRTLGYSSYWEIEASIYMVVAATFLASPYTLMTRGHVSVDFLPWMMGQRAARVIQAGIAVVGIVICLYMAWLGWHLTLEAIASDERSTSMWRPVKWPLYVMMPIGLGLTALQYLAEIFRSASDEAPAKAPLPRMEAVPEPAPGRNTPGRSDPERRMPAR
ncbi:TRAP transporter small permease subunit [Skermanella rosea]|uniref:TRAP transporter small permease subunit n=1 Tax=Skermanella rosea TaxID=1817965 RepID=UPI001931614A|nr:TRAP transporter small permease subunit [Skermanella rosea]UEM04626.1 TRAP transporter small permease subunit [Skermanella rosea]